MNKLTSNVLSGRLLAAVFIAALGLGCGSDAAKVVSLSVSPAAVTVTLGGTQQFVATATLDNLTTKDVSTEVVWATSAPAVATVGVTGLATGVSNGSAVISATLKKLMGGATMTVSDAALTAIAITPPAPSVAKGTTVQLTATGTFSDGTTRDITMMAAWSSATPTVASTADAARGLVNGVETGSAVISAALAGIQGAVTVTVTAATLRSLAITPANPTFAKGTGAQLTATGTFTDNSTQDLTATAVWASSDAAVAGVTSPGGVVAGLSVGTATVTATVGAVSANTTITVTAATLSSIAVTPANPSIAKGTTQAFVATGTFSDNTTQNLSAQVAWSSSNLTVAVISDTGGTKGEATGVAAGTATITATLGTVSGTMNLTVTVATLMSIAVTPTNPSVAKGSTRQFTATGTYTDLTTQDLTNSVTWTSSALGVATVSNAAGSHGLATTILEGTTTIGAASGAVAGSTTLTVTAAALRSIAVTPTTPGIANGTSQQFVATGTYTDNSTQVLTAVVTWSSSADPIAVISNAAGSKGLAVSVAPGTAMITATSGAIAGSTLLTVTNATLVSIAVTPTTPSSAKGTVRQFAATGTYSDNSTQDLTLSVTWSSSMTGIALISNANGTRGEASAVAVGTSTITATQGSIAGSTTFTVTAATLVSIAVDQPNASDAKGTTRQFAATGTYTDSTTQDLTDTVTWASTNEAAATISNADGSRGLATAVNMGVTTITASAGQVIGSTGFTVTAATLVSIAVSPTSPQIPVGISQAFQATGTYTDNSTQDLTTAVTWSSSAPSAATVSNAAGEEGVALGLAAGPTTISATSGAIVGSTVLTISTATLATIAVTPSSDTVPLGLRPQYTATGTYSDASTYDLTDLVVWGSSMVATATVSNADGSRGLVTTLATGATLITATLTGISGAASLTVSAAALASIAVTPSGTSIADGTTQQFMATGTYTDSTTQDLTLSVTWSSSDSNIASISNAADDEGEATGNATGNVTISATQGGITGSTGLAVTAATLVSIAVTPNNPSIAKGTTVDMIATGRYTDNSTQDLTGSVTWSSSDNTIVTVDNALSPGLASGELQGNVTITANLGGIYGLTGLTVTAATLKDIAVTPTNPSSPKGTSLPFIATGTYTDNTTQDLTASATWSSSMGAVASVSNVDGSQGIADALTQGTTTISAIQDGITGASNFTVTAATLKAISVTPATPSRPAGVLAQFTATGTFTDNTVLDLTGAVTWSSSNGAAAVISNAAGSRGRATTVAAGVATITATQGAISGSTALTVNNATLQAIGVTPPNISLAKGYSSAFTAIGVYSDNSNHELTELGTWGAVLTTVATVSNAAGSEGVGYAAGVGSTQIYCTYQGVTGTTNLTVTSAVLTSITLTPVNGSIPNGRTTQYTATGIYSDGSSGNITNQVLWESSDEAKAIISNAAGSHGLATGVAVGPTTIKATLSGISQSTTLTVTNAVLSQIQISPPAQIVPAGLTQQYTATGVFSDSTTSDLTDSVTWQTSNAAVASISNADGSHGLATAAGTGTASLSATSVGITGTTTITVSAAVLQTIAVTRVSATVPKGRTSQFTAIGTYSDGSTLDITTQATWSPMDSAIATVSNAVDSNGLATGEGVGATTIYASLSGKTGSNSLTVTDATLVSVAVTPANPTTPKGFTAQFIATGTYTDNSTQILTDSVTWTATDTNLVDISNTAGSRGLATALNVGTTTVTASIGGITGNTSMTVTNAVLVSIALTPVTPTTNVTQVEKFVATGTYSDNSTLNLTTQVTWTSSDTNKVSISNVPGAQGFATALTPGTSTITAARDGITGTTLMTVTGGT